MIRKLPILLALILLVSCVYTAREDISALSHMGGEGKAVITVDVKAAAELLPENELIERVDRISIELTPSSSIYPLPLSDWRITGTANGLLSSTEVGTLMIWDSGFIRARESNPRYYYNKKLGVSAGIPADGIVLFTSEDYQEECGRLFSGAGKVLDDRYLSLLESSLAGVYMDSPETLPPLPFDIPAETVGKIESILLLLNKGDDNLILSGEIEMDSESSAKTLCTFLRNLLIQEVRRSGGKLDVRALSGIFTYEGALLKISGYDLSYDIVSSMLTKE